MEYYSLMMLIGGCILYCVVNLYSIVLYITKTIKSHDWEDWLNMPFIILVLLIPIVGTLIGVTIIGVEDVNKFFKIMFYTSMYLIIIGFAILIINSI